MQNIFMGGEGGKKNPAILIKRLKQPVANFTQGSEKR